MKGPSTKEGGTSPILYRLFTSECTSFTRSTVLDWILIVRTKLSVYHFNISLFFLISWCISTYPCLSCYRISMSCGKWRHFWLIWSIVPILILFAIFVFYLSGLLCSWRKKLGTHNVQRCRQYDDRTKWTTVGVNCCLPKHWTIIRWFGCWLK